MNTYDLYYSSFDGQYSRTSLWFWFWCIIWLLQLCIVRFYITCAMNFINYICRDDLKKNQGL